MSQRKIDPTPGTGKIIGDVKDSETFAFVSNSQTTPKGLKHSDFAFWGACEHDIINIPNVNASAERPVARNNDCICFIFYYFSYLFSGICADTTVHEKNLSVFIFIIYDIV